MTAVNLEDLRQVNLPLYLSLPLHMDLSRSVARLSHACLSDLGDTFWRSDNDVTIIVSWLYQSDLSNKSISTRQKIALAMQQNLASQTCREVETAQSYCRFLIDEDCKSNECEITPMKQYWQENDTWSQALTVLSSRGTSK